jgi:signal recognition particle receptor subunit beta
MNDYKFIFTGPTGSGKTTAVAAISDIEVVQTEANLTAPDDDHNEKKTLTVGLDYGNLTLENKDKIHLYGTPGQERFDFMWEILSEGGLGLILLLDNSRTDPIEDMHFFMKFFKEYVDSKSVVIGVTHMDINPMPTIASYHEELQAMGAEKLPVFEVDARRKKDISTLLQALLYALDPGL